jgi:hypothetical protein
MNYRSGILTGVLATLATLGSAVGAWWLVTHPATGEKPSRPPPHATVGRLVKEDQFNTITLTAEAQKRLAVQTGKIEQRSVRRRRLYGGEVTVPPGQTIVVSAPLCGVLELPEGSATRAGSPVKKGQHVYNLLPMLTPEGRVSLQTLQIESDGQVNNASTAKEAAKVALNRARRMLRDETGSRKLVEDAQEKYDIATRTLEAATARRALLVRAAGEGKNGTAMPLPIDCPCAGLVRNVSALPGQIVPSGAALFEVVNIESVWLRVPVFAGDLPDIDVKGQTRAGNLAARAGQLLRTALPVDAPPSANPAAGTVDLFYKLDNRGVGFRPGERVTLSLPLTGEALSLTAPWAAVVYDIHGGAWVYEHTSERTYVRRRVVVRFTEGDLVVLDAGPPAGTRVVTAGAAELFGVEVGFGK